MVLAYKTSPYLEACILSLLAQTWQSRIIITTSTPNSHIEEIARKYDIELRINDNCGNIASDWNFAFAQSPTDLLTLAHQDDIYHPEYSSQVIKSLRKSSDSLIAFTDYEELVNGIPHRNTVCLIVKRLLLWPFYIKRTWTSKLIKKIIIYPGNPICCPSVSFNRSNLQDFKFHSEYSVNLDWSAWLDLAEYNGSFSFISKCLMQHRLCPENETAASIIENRRQQEDAKIFMRLWPAFMAKILTALYSLSYIKEKHDG